MGMANIITVAAIMLSVFPGQSAWAVAEFSPSFLGMYRKTIAIEQQLFVHAAQYGIDPRLARALIMQESGGNADLVSATGAQGYFQVLPEHFPQLGVSGNIEAGMKRLSQLQQRLGREDYVLAAYQNESSVKSVEQPLSLASLQYVMQVRHYKSILCRAEADVRRQAETLQLLAVRQGDSWSSVAQRTAVSEALLRLYNPVLSAYPLRADMLIAHPVLPSQKPQKPQTDTVEVSQPIPHGTPPSILEIRGATVSYTSRIGDSALNLARVFGLDLEAFLQEHQLWQLQQLPVGTQLTAKLPYSTRLAPRRKESQPVHKPHLMPVRSRTQMYTVRPGDTLVQIARRHGISVRALMRANRLHTSHLQIGEALRIPGAV
jgi:LysM repeat protein